MSNRVSLEQLIEQERNEFEGYASAHSEGEPVDSFMRRNNARLVDFGEEAYRREEDASTVLRDRHKQDYQSYPEGMGNDLF